MVFRECIMAGITVIIAVISAVTDRKKGCIPNIITIPMTAAGILHTAFVAPKSLIVTVIGLVFFFMLWVFHLFGGGDAKLMMGICALNGYFFSMISLIAALILFLIIMLIRNRKDTKERLKKGIEAAKEKNFGLVDNEHSKKAAFAPYLLFGVCVVAAYTLIKTLLRIS